MPSPPEMVSGFEGWTSPTFDGGEPPAVGKCIWYMIRGIRVTQPGIGDFLR
jgi:hypothetical protein